MAALYNLLNPDGTEVEEQRIISAPGATVGDVLTVNADGTVSPAAGGGTLPFARNVYQASLSFGEDVTVNGSSLTLAADSGDATMVDLTTPTYPKIITPGVYAFTTTMAATALGSAGGFGLRLVVDDNYYSITADDFKRPTGAGESATLCVVWWCDANDPFALKCLLESGQSAHYAGDIYLQRLA